jgi:uncharacterized membrane protein
MEPCKGDRRRRSQFEGEILMLLSTPAYSLALFLSTLDELPSTANEWIELSSLFIEILAILIIVGSVLFGSGRYLYLLITKKKTLDDTYLKYKHFLGRSLLLGLEILVAADVVRTVALEPTLINVASLGLLVLVRTFLSWSLVVEIEGRWPWQAKKQTINNERNVSPLE